MTVQDEVARAEFLLRCRTEASLVAYTKRDEYIRGLKDEMAKEPWWKRLLDNGFAGLVFGTLHWSKMMLGSAIYEAEYDRVFNALVSGERK